MAEPATITAEEYHSILGSSDEENDNIDPEGSDIEVQEVDSDEEEEDVEENDNADNMADAIDKETAWSNELSDFVINQFNDQPGIRVDVPEEPRSDFFFNLLDKSLLPTTCDSGICLIMGINNLPRLAM